MKDRLFKFRYIHAVTVKEASFNCGVEMINREQLADYGGNRNTSNTGNRTKYAWIRTIRGTEAKQWRVEQLN